MISIKKNCLRRIWELFYRKPELSIFFSTNRVQTNFLWRIYWPEWGKNLIFIFIVNWILGYYTCVTNHIITIQLFLLEKNKPTIIFLMYHTHRNSHFTLLWSYVIFIAISCERRVITYYLTNFVWGNALPSVASML